jgi:DNA repair protein RadC
MVREASMGRQIGNAAEVFNVVKPMFAEQGDVERFYGIFLNTNSEIIAIEQLFSGSIASAAVYPREIVKRILELKANALILAHNHPSGSTTPSLEDKVITTKICTALQTIDVRLLDHLIVGYGYHSMSESGWLDTIKARYKSFLAQRL